MSATTGNSPELTREQVLAILVKPLEAASVFPAAQPRIFDVTAAGVVRIPTLVGMDAPASSRSPGPSGASRSPSR